MTNVKLKDPNLGDAGNEQVKGAIASVVRRSHSEPSAMHDNLPFVKYSPLRFGVLITVRHPRSPCPIHENLRELDSTVLVLVRTPCQTERSP